MKRVIGFYRLFFNTLLPKNYEGFAESTKKNAHRYYMYLIVNAFVLMILLMSPVIVQLPSVIESKFKNVDALVFSNGFRTTEPIKIPEKNPIILINYANKTPIESANIIINNNRLYGGFLMQKFEKDLTDYKDAKANSSEVSKIIAAILLLMLPTLLLIMLLYLAVKYYIIILIASIIGIILAWMMGYRITFKKVFNSAVYGSSLSIFLDRIFFAVGFSFYGVQYIPLVIFLISGIVYSGDKVDKKMKGKYLEVKG